MSQGLKIGVAVVGGYILGRRKKAKLALGMGLYLAGKKLNIDPKQVASLLTKQLGESPQFAQLREQAQGELVDVGKVAAGALVNRQANRFADALHERTRNLQDPAPEPEPDEPDEPDAGDEEPEKAPARGKRGTSGKPANADTDEHEDEDGPVDEDADEPPARAPAKRRPAASRRSGSTAAKNGASRAKTPSRGGTATKTAAPAKRRKRSTGGES